MLLTGRLDLPVGFSTQNVPNPNEYPSMPALVNFAKGGRGRNNLPPAIVLPEPSVNEAGRVRPGQYAGARSRWTPGTQHGRPQPWATAFVCNASAWDTLRAQRSDHLQTPRLTCPTAARPAAGRIGLLTTSSASAALTTARKPNLDRHRKPCRCSRSAPPAFEVEQADPHPAHGRNKFGLSLLMASAWSRRASTGAGEPGQNSSWDTHAAFPNLKDNLFRTSTAASPPCSTTRPSGMLMRHW